MRLDTSFGIVNGNTNDNTITLYMFMHLTSGFIIHVHLTADVI